MERCTSKLLTEKPHG